MLCLLCLFFLFNMLALVESQTWAYQSCSTSTDCAQPKICVNGVCRTCVADAECSALFPSTPHCQVNRVDGNSCEECVINEHCTSSTSPRCSNNVCTGCLTATDCTSMSGRRGICQANGACVECTQNTDCTGSTNHCDGGFCVVAASYAASCAPSGCLFTSVSPSCNGGYCKSCGADPTVCTSSGWYCGKDGYCHLCAYNIDCHANNAQARCDQSTGYCSICTKNYDCTYVTTGSYHKCLAGTGCVGCLSDLDCLNGQLCYSGWCGGSAAATPLQILISSTTDPSIYTIDFSNLFVDNANVQQGISIKLSGVASSSYSYSVSMVTTTQYQVTFTVYQEISITTMELLYSYTPTSSQPDDIPLQFDVTGSTQTIPYTGAVSPTGSPTTTPSTEEETVDEEAITIGQRVLMAVVGASGTILALGGNAAVIWALISMIQAFYYLMFVNVNYPLNVKSFLEIFTLADFDFIPNPMKWFTPDIEDLSLPTPARFEEYGEYGLFLNNAGNMLLIWFVVLVIYIISSICTKYLKRLSKWAFIFFSKMIIWFEWGGVLRALTASYPELIKAAFLQVRVLNYDSSVLTASSVIAIIFTVYAVLFPVIICFVIKKTSNSKSPRWRRKFTTLTHEFTPEGVYPKYFTSIFLFKWLLIMATIVFLHNYPYIEIFALTAISIITIALLSKCKPYETKFYNSIHLAIEIFFLIVHVIIMALIHDDKSLQFSETQRLYIGWALIGLGGIIIALNFVTVMHELIDVMKEAWQLLKRVLQNNNKPKKTRIKPSVLVDNTRSSVLADNSLEVSKMMSPDSSSFHNTSVSQSPYLKRTRLETANGGRQLKRIDLQSFDESRE